MKNHQRPRDYAEHVEHPRFGKAPRFTGLDPDPDSPEVHLHWNTRFLTATQLRNMEFFLGWTPSLPNDGTHMVRGTAIVADVSRQSSKPVPVTHYYDIDKICRDCGRRFIFFAEEQRHWYEELGFPLEADAVRCPPCRKQDQQVAAQRKRYEKLCHVENRTLDESFDMAECGLNLIDEAIFHPRQSERVRMLLKRVPAENQSDQRFLTLTARLHAVEARWKAEKAVALNDGNVRPPGNAGVEVA